MAQSLGILVNSDENFGHAAGLTSAAVKRDAHVTLFFTGQGVRCAQIEGFAHLAAIAEVWLCRKSLKEYGVPDADLPPELPPRRLADQSAHADMIDRVDRYVVF